jgi:hypothetical protein
VCRAVDALLVDDIPDLEKIAEGRWHVDCAYRDI